MKQPCRKVILQDCSDERGNLKVLSYERELPFEVKRAFFTYHHADASVRGGHANLYSRLAFVCLQGSCELHVDDGEQTCSFMLNDPGEMLIVEPVTWKKLEHYSTDCILLVLSDCLYSQEDIVRDYDLFLKKCREAAENG